MIQVRIFKEQRKFSTRDTKIFNCPDCHTLHTFYYDSPMYCQGEECDKVLPNIVSLLMNRRYRAQWHLTGER